MDQQVFILSYVLQPENRLTYFNLNCAMCQPQVLSRFASDSFVRCSGGTATTETMKAVQNQVTIATPPFLSFLSSTTTKLSSHSSCLRCSKTRVNRSSIPSDSFRQHAIFVYLFLVVWRVLCGMGFKLRRCDGDGKMSSY